MRVDRSTAVKVQKKKNCQLAAADMLKRHIADATFNSRICIFVIKPNFVMKTP